MNSAMYKIPTKKKLEQFVWRGGREVRSKRNQPVKHYRLIEHVKSTTTNI